MTLTRRSGLHRRDMKQETKGSDMIDYDQEFDRGKNTKLNLDMHEELDSSHKKKENDLLGA